MSLRNRFLLLCLLSSLVGFLGCGSSTTAKPNPQGFTNSNLTGTYVFSTSGTDANNNFITTAGAFVADGKGGVSGGTMDVVDSGVALASPPAQPITSGSYSVSSDGRGTVRLTSSVGTFAYAFVLTTGGSVSAHGLISEFDGNGTGSGTLDLQTPVTSLTQLAGSYAFNLSGVDINVSSFAADGSFTLDGSGNITAGVEDLNDAGLPYSGQSLSGSATLGSGTAPGSISLTSTSFALTYDFYPIDASHFKLIETDFTEILAGDAFSQTGATIPNGNMVFTMLGGTSTTGPIATGGLMTSDGTGNFTNGLEDVNDNGTLSSGQLAFAGTGASGGGVGGRVIVTLTGFFPATSWVIYPSSGGLLMLEADSATVTQGIGFAQSATAFSTGTSVGYGMNLTGFDLGGGFAVDDISQLNATTGTSNNLTGVLDENDQGSLIPSLPVTGTNTPDSPATGRGSISVPRLGTPLGGLSLEYYVVDTSTSLLIEADTLQVSAGILEMQGSPTSGAMRARLMVVQPKSSARRQSKLRHK
jgi:hypothetical protein